MSINKIIQSLTNLLEIHEELIDISERKTEVIKDGLVEKLQEIVIAEHKVVQKLENAEINRQELVKQWFDENNQAQTDQTITQLLELLTDEADQAKLGEITLKLTKVITKLKQHEQLNEALLKQSLQFVQLSLNTMKPTIENLNYGNQKQRSAAHSVFDSKA